MDYLFFQTILRLILALLILYDIVCQWVVHLFAYMTQWFSEEMHLNLSKVDVCFTIPKKHFHMHSGLPHLQYLFNYLPNVGWTYGECIETHWSHVNPLSLSTWEISNRMWHEVMNDNWGAWNWQKTLKFGKSILIYWSLHSHNTVFSGMFLMCSLEKAHEMYIK